MSENEINFENRISILPMEGEWAEQGSCCTFAIKQEDHTIGGILRYIVSKNPNVNFSAYTIPHPAEDLMHFRIETNGKQTAVEALRQALTDISEMADHMVSVFQGEVEAGNFPFVALEDP